MAGWTPGRRGASPTGATVSSPAPPTGTVENEFWCAERDADPEGTDAVAVPAIRNRAEAVAMTKRFM